MGGTLLLVYNGDEETVQKGKEQTGVSALGPELRFWFRGFALAP